MRLKKYLGFLLSGIMVLSMAACAGTDKGLMAAPESGQTEGTKKEQACCLLLSSKSTLLKPHQALLCVGGEENQYA